MYIILSKTITTIAIKSTGVAQSIWSIAQKIFDFVFSFGPYALCHEPFIHPWTVYLEPFIYTLRLVPCALYPLTFLGAATQDKRPDMMTTIIPRIKAHW